MIRPAIATLAVVVQVLLPIVIVGAASAEKWASVCSSDGMYLVLMGDGARATSLFRCVACPICPVQFTFDGGRGPPRDFKCVRPERLYVKISQRVFVRPTPVSQLARSSLQPRGPPFVS